MSDRCRRWVLAMLVLYTGALMAALELNVDDGVVAPTDAPKKGIFVPKPEDGDGIGKIPVDPFGSLLVFKNGDRLHGRLLSVVGEDGLKWERQDTTAPTTFKTDGLYGLKLARGRMSDEVRQAARVMLTNGDTLVGNIVTLDEKVLKLDTSYGGELQVKRYMIASIHPPSGHNSQLVYDGPTDMNEWTKSSGEWEVRRGVLTGHGRVGADLKLPDISRIKFTVMWPGRYTNFSSALYAKDIRNFYQDAYHLTFSGSNVSLHRRSQSKGTLNLGQVAIPQLRTRNKSRFEVLVDRKEGRFVLIIDDRMIKEWTDPQGFASAGTGLMFNGPDRNNHIGISNIMISAWDGKIGQLGEVDAKDEDIVQFGNFDRISGEITSIAKDTLSFKTPYNSLDVPMERVMTVALGKVKAQRARRYAQDVELFFSEGERVTVRLAQIKDGKVRGYSENMGDVVLDIDAFQGMRINIYDEDEAAREMEGTLFEAQDLAGLIIE